MGDAYDDYCADVDESMGREPAAHGCSWCEQEVEIAALREEVERLRAQLIGVRDAGTFSPQAAAQRDRAVELLREAHLWYSQSPDADLDGSRVFGRIDALLTEVDKR